MPATKKVLLITDVNFWENSSGNRARISSLIRYLAQQVQLTVVNTGPAQKNIETVLNDKFKADFFVLEKTKYLSSNGYGRKLQAFLKDKKFDIIIIEYVHCSYFLNFLVEDATVILDAHDIISDRADEFKKNNYAGALYEISKETETEIFNVYDFVMVLCTPDHKKVSSLIGPGKALLCPHPVTPQPRPIKSEVKSIAFIASVYLPNIDAINFFIRECWPGIAEKYPVKLIIYGTVCHELRTVNDKRIVLKGFVENPDEIYADADIIINPVRFGAGLKIKNIDALANGIPLVTTTHGARGIEKGIGNAFLVADGATEFIKAIEILIESVKLRTRLGKNAIDLVNENFSEEKCFKPLINVIG
jgi:glycosyltransferase involved in cell wall biosynthesis